MKGQVLIIEDDKDMCEMLEAGLARHDFSVTAYQAGREGLSAIDLVATDVILADINLPDINGLELCNIINSRYPEIPVIIMTAFGSLDTAIGAIRSGAFDFITKPLDIDILTIALERAIRVKHLQTTVKQLSGLQQNTAPFAGLIGNSKVMQELVSQIRRIADSDASLLICGESGSGKELVAKAVHKNSRRKDQPLVTINCAAMPSHLLESELFGHKKGAFTDAVHDHKGLFLEANGGTLFLDEIGELSLDLQPKLLRALEEKVVRHVGGTIEQNFDVRIIAATNRDLESAVEDGEFREDLFYRLNVIMLDIPPLRSRGTDILLLAKYFLEKLALNQEKPINGISEATAKKLLEYSWPGNVRELRNAIEHAVALTQFENITPEDLPEKIRIYHNDFFALPSHDPLELISMEELEQKYIHHVLNITKNNRTLASKILKMDRKTLYRKLQKYEM